MQVVKAGESTSFDVVFLARVTGSARNLLYIQSSQGTFEYEVRSVVCVGVGCVGVGVGVALYCIRYHNDVLLFFRCL